MRDSGYSRRAFLAAGVASSALAAEQQEHAQATSKSPLGLTEVDFRKLISRSDLIYTKPVPRSEEGMPVGNGRMGSLVWTTPAQLRLQINRADVYANNCATNSFFERHNDYCGGCAYLDIEFGGQPFPESGFRQHLSVYDGALDGGGRRSFRPRAGVAGAGRHGDRSGRPPRHARACFRRAPHAALRDEVFRGATARRSRETTS